MGLMDAPRGMRLHIGIFGRRNVGKSSLLNAITRQDFCWTWAVILPYSLATASFAAMNNSGGPTRISMSSNPNWWWGIVISWKRGSVPPFT